MYMSAPVKMVAPSLQHVKSLEGHSFPIRNHKLPYFVYEHLCMNT